MWKRAVQASAALLVLTVLGAVGFFASACIQSHEYGTELDKQWEIIDRLVADLPSASSSSPISLHSVWGNAIQLEFFPVSRGTRSLEEMKALTRELQAISNAADADRPSEAISSVYELLQDAASHRSRDYVARQLKFDRELLASLAFQ